MKRAVFLDRDGVLNSVLLKEGVPHPPENVEDLKVLPGVLEALSIFKKLNYEIVVVTNQPDVSRERVSREIVDSLNISLGKMLEIGHFYVCPHDDLDHCSCRKPSPGLLTEAAKDLGIDLSTSFMIGDRWRDVGAGQSAGCVSYFIDYSYTEKMPDQPFISVKSLLEAARHIERNTFDAVQE